ncbi:MAG: ABC transporter ATP-binding protein [Deltaproteobacteria bacterium]|nr:ABC transporter ATP-binding protein [Deltaproteobacteria bacterium]
MSEPPDDAVLAARGLVRRFGAFCAVAGLSLHVRRGELYGLVGPDGAGKTTAIRMLTGLVAPDGGQALVLGRPAAQGDAAAREAIGYMPQQYSLYGDLSVAENLRFFGTLFALGRREFAARSERLLRITRLDRFSDRRADALSGGMYKKLALACALLHQPAALVLDEPTNGVDPVSRRELWDLLYEFVEGGMAVLLATPYMDEAERCHRVGLIHRGALLAEGDPRALCAGFRHASFVLASERRSALEALLAVRPGVLSLTPHGASVRVVVDGAAAEGFAAWAATRPEVKSAERVRADFEDVFLGLCADQERAGVAAGAGAVAA